MQKHIKNGIVLANCDQVESVEEAKRKRHIVKREVTRLITPGTITEERFLPPRAHNFLASGSVSLLSRRVTV
jgi:DNA mismatch repair protein MutS